MDPSELRQQIRHLLDSQGLAVLATSAGGHPYTTLVGFAAAGDGRELYFVTHRATRKFANLSGDDRVSLLIDNRSNRAEDFRRAAALTAFGRAREVPAPQRAAALELFLAKHPLLREFAMAPGSALCRVAVQRYSLVQRFQEVVEWILDDPDPRP